MKRQKPGLSGPVSFLAHATEAVDVVPETNIRVTGIFIVTIAASTNIPAGTPRPTTQNFCLSGRRAARIFFRRLFIIVDLVEIVAPFPNVSGNVVKTPGIWFLLANGFG